MITINKLRNYFIIQTNESLKNLAFNALNEKNTFVNSYDALLFYKALHNELANRNITVPNTLHDEQILINQEDFTYLDEVLELLGIETSLHNIHEPKQMAVAKSKASGNYFPRKTFKEIISVKRNHAIRAVKTNQPHYKDSFSR